MFVKSRLQQITPSDIAINVSVSVCSNLRVSGVILEIGLTVFCSLIRTLIKTLYSFKNVIVICLFIHCVQKKNTHFCFLALLLEQELSYRKQITRQMRTQYVERISRPKYYTVTLKSSFRVTQGHWKRNHWIDHTRLTISRVIWRCILSWPWNVGWTRSHSRSLKVVPFESFVLVSYSSRLP